MLRMTVLTATKQKAGSLRFLNMVNDLLIAARHHDSDDVRRKDLIGWFIRESVYMPIMRFHKALHLSIPHLLGNIFAVHTHSAPSPSARYLIFMGSIGPIYVY